MDKLSEILQKLFHTPKLRKPLSVFNENSDKATGVLSKKKEEIDSKS